MSDPRPRDDSSLSFNKDISDKDTSDRNTSDREMANDRAEYNSAEHNSAEHDDQSWQGELAEGRADRALQRYLAEGAPDFEVQDALDGLAAVQRHLRAKRYRKAQQALELLDVPPDAVSETLPWGELPKLLETLRESNDRLEHRDSDATLDLLQDLDHPLVRAEADTQRGTAYIFQNDTDAAGDCFGRALNHDPNHYRALTNHGNLALEAGDTDTAIERYEAALRLNEDFANAHHNLAVAYRRKGHLNKSVRSMRKAQKAMQQHQAQEARTTLSRAGQRFGGKTLKWVLYGVGVFIVFYLLQSRGVF